MGYDGCFFWDPMGFLMASGWWFQPTPLKNDGVKVSWDDDIPNIWKNKKMFQTANQYI